MQRGFQYDAALVLRDAGAVTSSRAATVGGNARVLTLGPARVDGRVIVDLTALTVNDNTERYTLITQYSESPTFASGVVNGAALSMGAFEVAGGSADTALGRHEVGFTNEINGKVYPYMRLYELIGGDSPSINFVAFAVLR